MCLLPQHTISIPCKLLGGRVAPLFPLRDTLLYGIRRGIAEDISSGGCGNHNAYDQDHFDYVFLFHKSKTSIPTLKLFVSTFKTSIPTLKLFVSTFGMVRSRRGFQG
ncbi:hypothetical protein B6U83_00430 [Thermoplasmatales archaeon ex4484_36]|nr:MAG: hypothetical protein B6U83_00430 [Thermoplasmatales archaeon ex4484_36]